MSAEAQEWGMQTLMVSSGEGRRWNVRVSSKHCSPCRRKVEVDMMADVMQATAKTAGQSQSQAVHEMVDRMEVVKH